MSKEDINIKKWYSSKTKLNNKEDLKYLKKYLKNEHKKKLNKIQLSFDYKFKYFDIDKINNENLKIRTENIFKINFLNVVNKLNKYFLNTKILVEIFFESSGENDNLIKKKNCTYKHDVYIKISNNDIFYDIGFEYFESSHDRIKDNDKEISSMINLDGYYMYNEKDLRYDEFMKESIYTLFLGICALDDNPYVLSKINYFINCSNVKTLKKETELFNNIICWKKLNSFNLKKFFEKSVFTNPDNGEEFDFDDFIEYLYDNYKIKIVYLNEKNCEYKYFVEIIMKINSECSDIISSYRILYTKTMEILFDSDKEILKWIKKSNDSKRLMPKYIDNFLLNHIKNYKCSYTLKKIHEELSKKFECNDI
jgi:hypothetical protein